MFIRWQMGDFDDGPSWDALELSVKLMQRLLPDATYVVTHEGPIYRHIDGVEWHSQPRQSPYCSGRHIPERYAPLDDFEFYQDNDSIIWELPPAWAEWERDGGVLIWRNDWAYYGDYSGPISNLHLGYQICPGMWGVGPGLTMPFPQYLHGEPNQDEYGWCAYWLGRQQPKHFVEAKWEVPIYCPSHNALKGWDRIGSHGVHINGLNRNWNPDGLELLMELRRKWL